MAALKADSDASMLAIFGDDYKHLIVQDDRAAASATRAKIYASMQVLRVLRESGPDRRMLLIGAEAWPMPIPIVRSGDRWRFASELGEDELVNRRIGANELNAIYVLRAFVDAQRAYAAVDRDGDGVRQYAQKLASTPGKRDGLYWTRRRRQGRRDQPLRPADRRERGLSERPRGRVTRTAAIASGPDAPGRPCRRGVPTTT